MPHTSSAKKRLRQTEKRRARNRAALRTIKEQIKKLLDVVQTGTLDDAKKEYNLAAKRLDKAAAHKVIHKNTAARRKSQLAKLVRDKQKTANTTPATMPAGTNTATTNPANNATKDATLNTPNNGKTPPATNTVPNAANPQTVTPSTKTTSTTKRSTVKKTDTYDVFGDRGGPYIRIE